MNHEKITDQPMSLRELIDDYYGAELIETIAILRRNRACKPVSREYCVENILVALCEIGVLNKSHLFRSYYNHINDQTYGLFGLNKKREKQLMTKENNQKLEDEPFTPFEDRKSDSSDGETNQYDNLGKAMRWNEFFEKYGGEEYVEGLVNYIIAKNNGAIKREEAYKIVLKELVERKIINGSSEYGNYRVLLSYHKKKKKVE